jgi:cytochrome c
MRKLIGALAMGLVVSAVSQVPAQDTAALAQGKGCMGCHAVDQARMGPSFKTLAAKYKGQAAAAGNLVAELRDGKGHMKSNATEAELRQLIDFVLAAQ